MSSDFVARLASRASNAEEVRSAWEVDDYVAALSSRPWTELDGQFRQLLHRDAPARRRIDAQRMARLLVVLAASPCAELNKTRLGKAADIPPTTVVSYLELLCALGLVRRVPGCRSAVAQRSVARPRLVFTDVGLSRHLAGDRPRDLMDLRGRRRLAPYLTSMVAAELLDQQETSAVPHRVSYLRERNGLEIDLVIELADGSVYGIEVRTAGGPRPHQFRRLEALRQRAGTRFRGGVVLNTASRGHRYRPGLSTLPAASVWDDAERGDGRFGARKPDATGG